MDGRREIRLLCIGLTVPCFWCMWAHLGVKPFWVDESIAVLPAKSILEHGLPRSPFDLNYMQPQLEDGLWDPSAPLYRYSVAAMAAVFGFSEASTRGWSLLLGLLVLVPCYRIFRRIYGSATAWIAVGILTSLPLFAYLSREARHFTFVSLMMCWCFYFLLRARDDNPGRARALWPAFLTATLLGHYVGYLALPVVLGFVLLVRGPPLWSPRGTTLLDKRHLRLYGVLGAVYLAIQAKYGNTLPVFHSIGCHNRAAGCEPDLFFYFHVILGQFGADRGFGHVLESAPTTGAGVAIMLLLIPTSLLVAGVTRTVGDAREDPERGNEHLFVLLWFFLPLLLLSTRELKFPRYMFYVLPPLALFVARGAVLLASKLRPKRISRLALVVITLVVILRPEVRNTRERFAWPSSAGKERVALRSQLVSRQLRYLNDRSIDNWERVRAKAAYLKRHMREGDVAVTSFDDASLGYYAGHWVHGFLNSEHDDRFFLDLLADAKQRGRKVHFIDSLPNNDFCHTPGDDPVNIPCQDKYAGFYAACLPRTPDHDPTCVRKYWR